MFSILSQAVRLSLIVALCYGTSSALPGTPAQQKLQRPEVNGAVSSEARECTLMGQQILNAGGNAVDAIVAMTLCVGVIGMYHSGIGGGGFMLVRDKKGGYEAIDFRETAPAAAHENMFKSNASASVYGGASVAIPGELRGLEYAHRKYGALSWESVVNRAAHFADFGFHVNRDTERYMRKAITGQYNFLVEDPSWAEDFAQRVCTDKKGREYDTGGKHCTKRLVPEGKTMSRRRYAETLRTIAKEGADAFYTGEIAENLIKTIQGSGGIMTLQDLADYKIVTRKVLKMDFKGHRLFGIAAPAGGAVTLNMLNILEKFGRENNKYQRWHNWVEGMKFAFGARGSLGDPAYVDGVEHLEEQMLSDKKGEKIRWMIDAGSTMPLEKYNPKRVYSTEGHGTSHLVAADKDGMAVSLTSTINLLFGSHLMDAKTGVILNNEMNDFSIPGVPNEFGFEPAETNFIRPGKRPLSSMTPIIVEHKSGRFAAAVGAAGGSRILTATAQTLVHLLDEGMRPKWAQVQPRAHHQLLPNELLLEHRFDPVLAGALRDRGHNVTWTDETLSAVQIITRKDSNHGRFDAASDPRQKNGASQTF